MRERDPDTRRSVAAVLDDVELFADLAGGPAIWP
jgi:hypothetical protein